MLHHNDYLKYYGIIIKLEKEQDMNIFQLQNIINLLIKKIELTNFYKEIKKYSFIFSVTNFFEIGSVDFEL